VSRFSVQLYDVGNGYNSAALVKQQQRMLEQIRRDTKAGRLVMADCGEIAAPPHVSFAAAYDVHNGPRIAAKRPGKGKPAPMPVRAATAKPGRQDKRSQALAEQSLALCEQLAAALDQSRRDCRRLREQLQAERDRWQDHSHQIAQGYDVPLQEVGM